MSHHVGRGAPLAGSRAGRLNHLIALCALSRYGVITGRSSELRKKWGTLARLLLRPLAYFFAWNCYERLRCSVLSYRNGVPHRRLFIWCFYDRDEVIPSEGIESFVEFYTPLLCLCLLPVYFVSLRFAGWILQFHESDEPHMNRRCSNRI